MTEQRAQQDDRSWDLLLQRLSELNKSILDLTAMQGRILERLSAVETRAGFVAAIGGLLAGAVAAGLIEWMFRR